MMIRKGDWSEGNIDMVFVENNLLLTLKAEGTINGEAWKNTIHDLFRLWRPDNILLSIKNGSGENRTSQISLDHFTGEDQVGQLTDICHQHTGSQQDDLTLWIESGIYGWNRIVVPEGADLERGWVVVDTDGMSPREYRIKPGEDYLGMHSIWFRMENASPATYFSLYKTTYEIPELKLILGPVFFNPVSDMRDPEQLVRGIKLAEWQDVNRAMLKNILVKLGESGWALVDNNFG